MSDKILPLTVYGSNISYFTGKLEMYLRAKGLPYTFEAMKGSNSMDKMGKKTGAIQMPAATLADGRWITDTTPIIAWLEKLYPTPPIVPTDPEQRFFSLLLEDYADEWLWRPAMHYRWYEDEGAMFASRHLADEVAADIPLPGWLKRLIVRRRQRGGYTQGDGVTEGNRLQVEAVYHDNLKWLSDCLEKRPFLLGDSPSLADIAFMGPFLRHFGQDPVPAEIMRVQAPAVWEWIARLWNYPSSDLYGDWLTGVPDDWGPWLDDIGKTYLPYLNENVRAITAGKKRETITVAGVSYPGARVSDYRIWCLEQLRLHYSELPESAARSVQQRLQQHGCWEPFWEIEKLDSGVNRDQNLPFGTNAKMLGA
ncbi:MAG: glutathione S-transferase [Halioglobus sp.]|jgi:glutathione S-transferase